MTGQFPQQLRSPQNLSLFLSGFFHPRPPSPPWYSTVTAAPRANIQTVAQPRGDAIGLADVEDCATSYTSRMLSNSVSGSGVTCLDAD